MEVFMKATLRVLPDVVERSVIVRGGATFGYTEDQDTGDQACGSKNEPFEDKFPIAAALLPCTSMLGEFVSGMSTSHIPISRSKGLRSSVKSGDMR
jgi:hypothetical protein